MGNRGPIPKRSEDRKRRNKTDSSGRSNTPTKAARGKVTIPKAASTWSPAARRLYASLRESGQSQFFESSDWAFAHFVMDEISKYSEQERQNGQVLASLLSALGSLLMTEGDRRRVSLELSRGGDSNEADENVLVMEEWRKRMGG